MAMEKVTWGLTYFDQFIYIFKEQGNSQFISRDEGICTPWEGLNSKGMSYLS